MLIKCSLSILQVGKLCELNADLIEKKKGRKILKINTLQPLVAERTGLEPATSAVTGQHSNQLNYRSNNPAYSQSAATGITYRILRYRKYNSKFNIVF